MRKVKFNAKDKKQFQDWGYSQDSINQIVRLKYRFHNYGDKELFFEEAADKFGRKTVLGSIGRAAFHSTGSLAYETGCEWGTESNLLQ
jgi:hypothetical protein